MNKEYVEVVLEGSFDLIKGFVIGFMEGRNISGGVVFEDAERVREGDALVRLLRFVRLQEDQVHLIVDAGIHELLEEAHQHRENELPIKIVSVRKIGGVWFEFRYRAYSPPAGEELEGLFRSLPEGLQLEGYEPRETVRPSAKGIEAYAPEHAYEVEAAGKIRGPAKETIDFYNRLERYELIELGDIVIEKG